jgi:hydroxypyruvate reductase
MLRFADHGAHLAALRAAALRAVDPASAVRRFFSPADIAGAERVFVVGAGNAGAAMARAAAEILGERLTAGVIAVPQLPTSAAERITFIEGGHPTPTEGTLLAGRAIADLLAQATARDLVVALISGGGSALLELPVEGLALADLRITNQQLLLSGAAVHEINVVRQRLSQLKGGGLARLAYPARVLGLILSDVVGNPLDLIASGPTVPATASPQAALAVVEKYHLRSALPSAVLRRLEGVSSSATRAADTSSAARSVDNRLIASNRLAGEAAAAAARELGFVAALIADDWQGEAREVGKRFAELVASPLTPGPSPLSSAQGRGEGGGVAKPGRGVRCLIVGGETTVTVRGAGRGGRNQEAALAAALVIDGLPNVVLSTFATDGVDGPTDAAGAIVTGDTLARARALGLDPQKHLDDNDSYSFFAALSNLVVTGPTGTNVNDLMFGLVYSRRADSV